MSKHVFASSVANLRSNGGDCETFVHLVRSKGYEGTSSDRISYDRAVVKVELLIPFTFSGEELCVIAEGKYCAEEPWDCMTFPHRKAKMEMALDMATEAAIDRAVDEVRAQLKKVRPTVSIRKAHNKTTAVMKQLYVPNLATPSKKEKK